MKNAICYIFLPLKIDILCIFIGSMLIQTLTRYVLKLSKILGKCQLTTCWKQYTVYCESSAHMTALTGDVT